MSRTERHNIFTGSKTVTADLSTGTAYSGHEEDRHAHAEGNAMVLRHELQCAAAYDGYKREQGCVGYFYRKGAVHRRLGGERCCP